MRTGRPKKPLEIAEEDRDKLSMIARRPKSAQAMAMRARIVLSCGQGMSNSEVARKLHITGATVGKWRERFREFGLDGLLDEPRVGAPRKITDRQIEDVVTKTLESMPANSTHWSTRLMAEQTGLSQNAIVRIWRAFGLQPHRVENFKFSKDPQFVEKVRDIVGLYLNPPDRAIVLCVDEKSQVQALNRTEPILPLAPGVPARQSHDYQRHGVTSLFAAMDVASGVTISTCYRRHRHPEFLRFLNEIEDHLPGGQGSRLVRATPALSRSFHADQRKLAQPGGATLRRGDRGLRPPRQSHSRSNVGASHARLFGPAESESQALRMDRRCRFDSRQG